MPATICSIPQAAEPNNLALKINTNLDNTYAASLAIAKGAQPLSMRTCARSNWVATDEACAAKPIGFDERRIEA